jgi:Type II secretory pathway, component PulF
MLETANRGAAGKLPKMDADAKFPVFDPLLVSVMKVGEESGMLYETLDKMATLYEQETEESTKKLTNMMEPAMTIIVALVVGTVGHRHRSPHVQYVQRCGRRLKLYIKIGG